MMLESFPYRYVSVFFRACQISFIYNTNNKSLKIDFWGIPPFMPPKRQCLMKQKKLHLWNFVLSEKPSHFILDAPYMDVLSFVLVLSFFFFFVWWYVIVKSKNWHNPVLKQTIFPKMCKVSPEWPKISDFF